MKSLCPRKKPKELTAFTLTDCGFMGPAGMPKGKHSTILSRMTWFWQTNFLCCTLWLNVRHACKKTCQVQRKIAIFQVNTEWAQKRKRVRKVAIIQSWVRLVNREIWPKMLVKCRCRSTRTHIIYVLCTWISRKIGFQTTRRKPRVKFFVTYR